MNSDARRFPVPVGCVHGRFQPLHNGHLAYILAAAEKCEFLWIGITRPEPSEPHLGNIALHRSLMSANPLSYYERATMIRASMIEAGLHCERFAISPFPIDRPDVLSTYLSTEVLCFTTIYDEWNQYKIQVLENAGYSVHVLWQSSDKPISGHHVRQLIASGTNQWREMVPEAIAGHIDRLRLRQRLLEMTS